MSKFNLYIHTIYLLINKIFYYILIVILLNNILSKKLILFIYFLLLNINNINLYSYDLYNNYN